MPCVVVSTAPTNLTSSFLPLQTLTGGRREGKGRKEGERGKFLFCHPSLPQEEREGRQTGKASTE